MSKAGLFLTGLALFAAACAGERPGRSGEEVAVQQGMEGGATHSMPSMEMLPAVRDYLDSVVRAEPSELVGMVAGHRERMEQMLAAMDRDMAAMNMVPDEAWKALADSVREDLAALSALRGEQLVLQMRAHAGRMRRLLQMHESMMRM